MHSEANKVFFTACTEIHSRPKEASCKWLGRLTEACFCECNFTSAHIPHGLLQELGSATFSTHSSLLCDGIRESLTADLTLQLDTQYFVPLVLNVLWFVPWGKTPNPHCFIQTLSWFAVCCEALSFSFFHSLVVSVSWVYWIWFLFSSLHVVFASCPLSSQYYPTHLLWLLWWGRGRFGWVYVSAQTQH